METQDCQAPRAEDAGPGMDSEDASIFRLPVTGHHDSTWHAKFKLPLAAAAPGQRRGLGLELEIQLVLLPFCPNPELYPFLGFDP